MESDPLRRYITEPQNPPQGSVISQPHQHQYQIIARDTVIARWCTNCGKTWIVIRYAQGGEFTHNWREISEP